MLCSSVFSYSYSVRRGGRYSYSIQSSIAIRPIGPQVPANGFDQRSASPQFKQPSSTSTVSLGTASLSTSTTKSDARDVRLDSLRRRDRATIRSRLIVGFGAILGSSIRSLICQIDRPRPNRFLYFCVILAQSFRIVSYFFGDLVPNPSNFFEYWRSCHGVTFPRAIPLE